MTKPVVPLTRAAPAMPPLKMSSHGTTATAVIASLIAASLLFLHPAAQGSSPPTTLFWLMLAVLGVAALWTIRRVAAIQGTRLDGVLTAALFGLWVLYFWQMLVVALEVPRVLLPAPMLIAQALIDNPGKLWGDFSQTVLKAVCVGWLLGSGLGFAVAVAIDRMPFLQRGLLPLASLTSTVPLVAVAPIAVMWFGFEWPSKAAVRGVDDLLPDAGVHAGGAQVFRQAGA